MGIRGDCASRGIPMLNSRSAEQSGSGTTASAPVSCLGSRLGELMDLLDKADFACLRRLLWEHPARTAGERDDQRVVAATLPVPCGEPGTLPPLLRTGNAFRRPMLTLPLQARGEGPGVASEPAGGAAFGHLGAVACGRSRPCLGRRCPPKTRSAGRSRRACRIRQLTIRRFA